MAIFKKTLAFILRFGISAAILAFLFSRLDIDTTSILGIVKHSDKKLLLCAFLVFFSSYVIGFFRWHMLLKGAHLDIPMGRTARSFAGGVFFNLIMPSSIGGDMVRSIDLAAHTKKPSEVVATVFLDRLSGYVGMVVVMMVAVVFGLKFLEDRSVILALSLIVGLLALVLVVLFNKSIYQRITSSGSAGGQEHRKGIGRIFFRFKAMIKSLHHEVHVFRDRKVVLLKNALLSVLIQVTAPAVFYLTALAMGEHFHPVYFFIFIPIIGAITLLPISIGGLGLRDVATVYFFAKIGMGKDAALAMSLLNFSYILACSALGGVVYVLTLHRRRLQPDAPSGDPPPAAGKE